MGDKVNKVYVRALIAPVLCFALLLVRMAVAVVILRSKYSVLSLG